MINRSLIRIKTVQILYSYLLTRNDFKLLPAPEPDTATRDQLYSWDVYLRLLSLLMKVSGRKANGRQRITLPRQIGKALYDDPFVRDAMTAHRHLVSGVDSLVEPLVEQAMASSAFADFKKKKSDLMVDEVLFWTVIFKTIVQKSDAVDAFFRKDRLYSRRGFEEGVDMLVESLRSLENDRGTYLNARRELDESMDRAYDLYMGLMALPLRLTQLQDQRYDEAKHKFVPTFEDLNPPVRFVDNLYVAHLSENTQLDEFLENNPDADPREWRRSEEYLDSMLRDIHESEIYQDYMANSIPDFAGDVRFWRDIMRFVILPSDALAEALESQSVYWNDDVETISTFVLKTLKRIGTSQDERIEFLPKFLTPEDGRFGIELFEYVAKEHTRLRALIDEFIDASQWDTERIPLMDIVVIMTAIAEMIHFPAIPVAVTLNEYIEIANTYCSRKSGQFVNGILYSVMNRLAEEGKLLKPLPASRKNYTSSNPSEQQ